MPSPDLLRTSSAQKEEVTIPPQASNEAIEQIRQSSMLKGGLLKKVTETESGLEMAKNGVEALVKLRNYLQEKTDFPAEEIDAFIRDMHFPTLFLEAGEMSLNKARGNELLQKALMELVETEELSNIALVKRSNIFATLSEVIPDLDEAFLEERYSLFHLDRTQKILEKHADHFKQKAWEAMQQTWQTIKTTFIANAIKYDHLDTPSSFDEYRRILEKIRQALEDHEHLQENTEFGIEQYTLEEMIENYEHNIFDKTQFPPKDSDQTKEWLKNNVELWDENQHGSYIPTMYNLISGFSLISTQSFMDWQKSKNKVLSKLLNLKKDIPHNSSLYDIVSLNEYPPKSLKMDEVEELLQELLENEDTKPNVNNKDIELIMNMLKHHNPLPLEIFQEEEQKKEKMREQAGLFKEFPNLR